MKNIVICGVFNEESLVLGGQLVKTRNYLELFHMYYNDKYVSTINTFNWRKKPVKLFLNCIKKCKKADILIILPAHNGIKVFSFLFLILKKAFKFQIYYSVIGGWLPQMLNKNKMLKSRISKFDGIWVETKTMFDKLKEIGLYNIKIVPNFKFYSYLPVEKNIKKSSKIIKFCFFSRVLFEKGIEDAIYVIKKINNNQVKCIFDIYGPIDINYKDKFLKLMDSFPNFIKYKGIINPDESVNVIANYDYQLFPTRYKTEGIPGSIIDSYAAGVPVISAIWDSFYDIVVEGVTGFGYIQYDIDDMYRTILNAIKNPIKISEMQINCKKYFEANFKPEAVWKKIMEDIKWD